MSKKVKCIECACATNWSLPEKVSIENIEYAKRCLSIAKRSISCDRTMKTKSINHEQYCKNFISKNEIDLRMSIIYEKEIKNLENMIQDYENNKRINNEKD